MRNLTQGPIVKQLITLAIPLMGTGFLQLAYNLTDIFWLGILSGKAVAAAGIAGFLAWFTYALAFTTKIGAEVGIAQAIGQKKLTAARSMGAHATTIALIMGISLGLIMYIFKDYIIDLFGQEADVNEMCRQYLVFILLGMPFWTLHPTFAGIYNGTGNSKTPFYVSIIGITLNITLDPLFIFTFNFGIQGASMATFIALLVEVIIFVALMKHPRYQPYSGFHFFTPLKKNLSWKLLKIGAPAAIQNTVFSLFSMVMATIAAGVQGVSSHVGVSVQSAGSQIESLSWVTSAGISTALGAYVGQNFGAKKFDRIIKSCVAGVGVICLFGAAVSVVFMAFGEQLFGIFVSSDAEVISEGAKYLFILGISQVFLCSEIATAGVFNGLGKSYYPAVIEIILNAARIPMALVLSSYMGLTGVWWAICISSIIKGIALPATFPLFIRREKRKWAKANIRTVEVIA
ncbi:MAG: MATE family efflux transporter [Prevotellaceae bacterium]|jgi:putative MATE family efflux protein|nr:MATE family efflux transporter [Prevotellaceae bacterium]